MDSLTEESRYYRTSKINNIRRMSAYEAAETAEAPPRVQWYHGELNDHILSCKQREKYDSIEVPPSNTVWNSAELARFYPSLSRHSRWRPDLIANECQKTSAEVQWLFELLERSIPQGRKHGERLQLYRYGTAPAALQVSEKWIAYEEDLAAKLEAQSPPFQPEPPRQRASSSDEYLQRKRRAERAQAQVDLLRQRLRTEWLEEMTAEKLRIVSDLLYPSHKEARIAEADCIIQELEAVRRTPEEQALYRKLTERRRKREAKTKRKSAPDKPLPTPVTRLEIGDRMTRKQLEAFLLQVDNDLAALKDPAVTQLDLITEVRATDLFNYTSLSRGTPISHSVLVTLTALVRQFLCQLVYDLIPLGDVDAGHVERALAKRNLAGSIEWDVKPELFKSLRRKERVEPVVKAEEPMANHHDAFPFPPALEEDTESEDEEADDEHVELEKAQEAMDRAMGDAHEETLWGRPAEADISDYEPIRAVWQRARYRRTNRARKRKLLDQLGLRIAKKRRKKLSAEFIDSSSE